MVDETRRYVVLGKLDLVRTNLDLLNAEWYDDGPFLLEEEKWAYQAHHIQAIWLVGEFLHDDDEEPADVGVLFLTARPGGETNVSITCYGHLVSSVAAFWAFVESELLPRLAKLGHPLIGAERPSGQEDREVGLKSLQLLIPDIVRQIEDEGLRATRQRIALRLPRNPATGLPYADRTISTWLGKLRDAGYDV